MAIIEQVDADEGDFGSDMSFGGWCAEHQDSLRSYCRAMLRDDAAAADVVQEALLRAWTRRRDFDNVVHWRRWLFCVARNLCIDTVRARERVAPAGLLLDEGLPSDDGASIDREIESRRVRTAFASLQPRQQELLYLHDVVGVAYAELGAQVGVSTGTARAAVFRARGSLRRRLGALRLTDA